MFEKIKSFISNFILLAFLFSLLVVAKSKSNEYISVIRDYLEQIIIFSLGFSLNLTLWNAVESKIMTRAELSSDAWLKILTKFRVKLITDDSDFAMYEIPFFKLFARREITIRSHQDEAGYLIVKAPKRIFYEYKQEV